MFLRRMYANHVNATRLTLIARDLRGVYGPYVCARYMSRGKLTSRLRSRYGIKGKISKHNCYLRLCLRKGKLCQFEAKFVKKVY